ncbi:hypothetical protein ACHAW5_005467 [Stephanodiscus triporus]|uniref:Protein SYS1 homolog n=1 Tax=Stephanodiscus triporus TaxID=2934178 RepID=A0ABD3QFK0_9STRA
MAIQRSNIIAANINGTTTPSSSSSSSSSNNNGVGTVSSSSSHRSNGSGLAGPPMSQQQQHQQQSFNPKLILSQILCLQCFHYLVLGCIFQMNHVLFATSVTIDRIFTDEYLDVWSALGWIDNAAVLTSSFVGSLLLAVIVEKSKKCLDFSVTLFVIHVVLCSVYSRGLPATWDWWIVHFAGMIMMVVLGEYFCSKRELSDIPLLVL